MANETQFKHWLKKNKPKDAEFTHIETSTIAGVPDTYVIYKGISTWIECKDIDKSKTQIKLRASQFMWMKKHIAAQGRAVLAIRRKDKSVEVYSGIDIAALKITDIKQQGKDYILPDTLKPIAGLKNIRDKLKKEAFYETILISDLTHQISEDYLMTDKKTGTKIDIVNTFHCT